MEANLFAGIWSDLHCLHKHSAAVTLHKSSILDTQHGDWSSGQTHQTTHARPCRHTFTRGINGCCEVSVSASLRVPVYSVPSRGRERPCYLGAAGQGWGERSRLCQVGDLMVVRCVKNQHTSHSQPVMEGPWSLEQAPQPGRTQKDICQLRPRGRLLQEKLSLDRQPLFFLDLIGCLSACTHGGSNMFSYYLVTVSEAARSLFNPQKTNGGH